MKKQNQRKLEEIAKDLESIDFAAISEDEIKEVFGSISVPIQTTNCNCEPW